MYKEIYEEWLNNKKLSEEEKKQLLSVADNETEIENRFGKDLEFGTAGMRGIIGLGTNMLNIYTVRKATQGLAEYINSLGKKAQNRGVVISYDTRRQSYEFAFNAAIVLVSNGIKAYLFSDVHPVPMLSYSVRELGAVAGIMITASHNPKEYNGYKLYGEDGAQLSLSATESIIEYINAIGSPLSDKIVYNEELHKQIKAVPKRIDRKYYKTLKKLCLSPKEVKKSGKSLKIVYTPVHGSGYIPVTSILKKIGIKPIVVEEQTRKDTEFSTVAVPNPEVKETLELGIKLADFKNADVVFGTDPDCDRLGVAIRNDKGEFTALTGNQTGVLLLDYILMRLNDTKKLDKKSFVVKSFVSTSLAKAVADNYGVELMEVPVGFKFIGEKIKQFDDTGKRKFVFGFEESCGYLRGTHSRDKDAVVASMLFAEMVCYYTDKNIGIYQKLQDIYGKYGYVYDTNVSTAYSGISAMKDMNAVVDKMKTLVIPAIAGVEVVAVRDYSSLTRTDVNGNKTDLKTAKVNAVYYELKNGGFVCVRPSGTEPKLKVYYSVPSDNEQNAKQLFVDMKNDFEQYLK